MLTNSHNKAIMMHQLLMKDNLMSLLLNNDGELKSDLSLNNNDTVSLIMFDNVRLSYGCLTKLLGLMKNSMDIDGLHVILCIL